MGGTVFLAVVLPNASGGMLFNFDGPQGRPQTGESRWSITRDDKNIASLVAQPLPGRPGGVIALPAQFPEPIAARTRHLPDWTRFDKLTFEVFLPPNAPKTTQLLVYVKDSELHWYQTLVQIPFEPGRWTNVSIDISATSSDWSFRDHYRPWSGYTRFGVRELGFRFFSREPYRGPICFDNVGLFRSRERIDLTTRTVTHGVIGFVTNSDSIGRYEKFEITFDLPRTYVNPFDPEEIDITAHFVAPSGAITVVPAFLYQGYLRENAQRVERLIPMGKSKWKVRFAPQELGTYRYFLDVRERRSFRTSWRSFDCKPSDSRGFVHISKKDPNYFEYDSGEFFYPIGQNVVADFDERNAQNLGIPVFRDEGTFAYDRFFTNMAANQVNLARVWMTSWWLGLEWTKKYADHYQDLGRYSMDNAWRLDHVVELAEKCGIHIMLLFTPHGHLTQQLESDWKDSPYNYLNGGFLSQPHFFFTSPEARQYYERRLRYILARWGYSTAVFSWEIFNEIDLAEYYRRQPAAIAEWIQKTGQFIRKHDQGKHVITTSLFRWNKGDMQWSLPEIEYTNAHIFDVDLPATLRSAYQHMQKYGKIFLVTECDIHPFGSGPETTETYVHVGLWSSHMMPFAGASMPWWWVFIDQRNLYHHFRALAEFSKGEDRRGKNLRFGSGRIVDLATKASVSGLGVECLVGDEGAFFWVYDRVLVKPQERSATKVPDKLGIVIAGMKPGKYTVEFWDTYKGEAFSRVEAEAGTDGNLLAALPKFKRDVAAKVKAAPSAPTPKPTEAKAEPKSKTAAGDR